MLDITYQVAPRGLATSFTETEIPLEYAARLRNRYINTAGGAEKRPGIVAIGGEIAGTPRLDAVHELVKIDGTAVLFVSGQGSIWRFDTSVWTQVKTGLDPAARLQSVQMGKRLIFVNGVDRNFYTEDAATFTELKAIIEQGTASALLSASTSAKALTDADIVNWVANTNVVINDLVYYVNRDAYGLVTAVTSAQVTHTNVCAAATGIGITTSGEAANGDPYQIIDMVELNIVPTLTDPDNVAVAGIGTSANVVSVSGLDFSTTDIVIGDFVANTTRAAVTRVTSVSGAINVVPITGQIPGDSLVFLKSAMPISKFAHVHYGRAYFIDARDQSKVRISGPNDPQDMTTGAGTLDSNSFSFTDLQPQGDTLLSMCSWQSFLVFVGRQNVYLYQGIDPIPSSAAANDANFSPVGLFPQGGVSRLGALSIGNDVAYVTQDGVQNITQVQNNTTLNRANLTEAIRKSVRDQIGTASEDDIVLIHYPARSWLLLKVGSLLYCYNYSFFLGIQPNSPTQGSNYNLGSWSVFDGRLAQCNGFLVRADGTLICCGPAGKVYAFDQGTFSDDGDPIETEYQTGWLTMAGQRKQSVKLKKGLYIKPQFIAGDNIDYTIRAEADYSGDSGDLTTITASGNATPIGLFTIGQTQAGVGSVVNVKAALRWRGEVARITFTTSDTKGPDIIGRFTLYVTLGGRQ